MGLTGTRIGTRRDPGHRHVLPDYAGGSILNLMASIQRASGGVPAADCAPLALLDGMSLASCTNLVLLVIDGFGAGFLGRHGAGSVLAKHRVGVLSSVFPSTTASAITTFLTGLSPACHGLTGWHMYFDELDEVLACLPLTTRAPRSPPLDAEGLPERLFAHTGVFSGMGRRGVAVAPLDISDSPFNRFHTAGAERLTYSSGAQLFERLGEALLADHEPKYIYAYYPTFDALAHQFGIDSEATRACFWRTDVALAAFIQAHAGSETVIIVTADHGFIDSPAKRVIDVARHPRMAAMLERPLCGERRVAYCYVSEARHEEFERYVKRHLNHAIDLVPTQLLLEQRWFGPGPPTEKLRSRVGDYALVMRRNWTIVDHVPGERSHAMIGVHGGTSAEEMLVPLALFDLRRQVTPR